MRLSEVLAALRASWWMPVLGLLLGGGATLAVSLVQTPLYTSVTQLFVSTSESSSTSDVLEGSQFSRDRVASYARLVTGEDLAARVIQRLELEQTPLELTKQIGATAVIDTVLIDVTVTDASPAQAQRIAQAVGSEFADLVTELESPAGGGVSPVKVTVTDAPEVSLEPSSPRTVRNVALGAAVGLAVGAALALLRARLDRSVKDAETLAQLVGAPVIGSIARSPDLVRQHLLDPGDIGQTAENYRQLRNSLRFLNPDRPPKVIMVSSAVSAEGKTTLVVNLALVLTSAGQRVCIVEADLRLPKVTRYLGLVEGAGLTNVLIGTADIEDVLQSYGERLSVVGAGPIPPNPGELLASGQMALLVAKLRADYDVVLVDAPPVLPVADSSGIAAMMDGLLLSVRYGSTRREQVHDAAATLRQVGGHVLGAVFNVVPPKAMRSSTYGYGYGASSAPAEGISETHGGVHHGLRPVARSLGTNPGPD